MSYGQPGPYGRQQPNPYAQGGGYGQQPHPGQPGHGTPGQGPAGPDYGYPPQGPPGPTAPYGQPLQPGPYGQAPQPPYGAGPSPYSPGRSGGGRKAGVVLGVLAAVATVAVGGYFLYDRGTEDTGLADDGPHKLVAPQTVFDEYHKKPSSQASFSGDLKGADKWGVKDAQKVDADYSTKEGANPMAGKLLSFGGVYGEIEDPEKTLDAFFAHMKSETDKGDGDMKLIGKPRVYEPAQLEGAVLKCQQGEGPMSPTEGGGPEELSLTLCAWSDHSTLGMAIPMEIADIVAGKASSPDEAAALTTRLREVVRVER